MLYHNELTITLRTNKTAAIALEIMRTRLSAGFDCDKKYNDVPSVKMMDDLEVDGRTITLPHNSGYYFPKDAEIVIGELLKCLAEGLSGKNFTCKNQNYSDEDMNDIEAQCKNGVLKVKTIYYPMGYIEFFHCEECGATVVWLDEYEEGETYICPDCGEVVDLSNQMPEVTEKTFRVI